MASANLAGNYRNVGAYKPEAMNRYMHHYCQQHPKDKYWMGVMAMGTKFPSVELPKQIPEEDTPADDPGSQWQVQKQERYR
jgi:hypothetical protein